MSKSPFFQRFIYSITLKAEESKGVSHEKQSKEIEKEERLHKVSGGGFTS